MQGLNLNMMGLLIAHSVAGKKLQGQQRTRALLTSAIVPAQGIAGVLTPMALAGKEVADVERRQAQATLQTETANAAASREATAKVVSAFAATLAAASKQTGAPLSLLHQMADEFSKREEIQALVNSGRLKPVEVGLADGSKVTLGNGVVPVLAIQELLEHNFSAPVRAGIAAFVRAALDANDGLVARAPSDSPPAHA